MVKYTYTAVQQ